VQVPTKLSDEAKEALKAYDMLTGNTLNQEASTAKNQEKPKKKGFMDKLKETFDD